DGLDDNYGAGFTPVNTDATDPFADAVGFTGVTTNPAFDPPGQSTADPLGVLTNEDKVTIADGVFSVTSSEQDSFGGGAGNSNTIRDNYQAGVDVSGLTSFELVARASSANFASVSSTTGGFEQFGIQIGAGGVDDFIKFVIQDNGNSAQRIQLGHNGTLAVGGDRNTAITSVLDGDGTAINLADVATYEFRLLLNRDAEIVIGEDTFTISVTPTIVFLDDAGDEIASFTGPAEAVSDTSAFAAALDGNNPLTGGTGGIAYGIFISDFGAGTANEITADYDFITLRALDDVPVSLVQDQTATFAEVGDTGTFTAPLVLTAAAFSGTTDVTYSIDGGTTELTQSITFIDGAASLVVDVPADDLANGSEVITVDLISFSDDRLVAEGSAATLDITIAEDDFAPVAEADVVSLEAGGTVTFNPAENDTDADDDAATLVVTEISNVSAAATEATVTLENDAVTVTALGAFTGSITFDYVVADQGGNTDTGMATVSVADTTAPVATLALDVPTAALGDIVVSVTPARSNVPIASSDVIVTT
ncbi:MAG: Ig-like domain-containing protein, partial [Pseudomonadota bacterium]